MKVSDWSNSTKEYEPFRCFTNILQKRNDHYIFLKKTGGHKTRLFFRYSAIFCYFCPTF